MTSFEMPGRCAASNWEVQTVFASGRRLTRGVNPLSVLLMAVILAVAACASSIATASGSLLGNASGANPTTLPVILPAATATPDQSAPVSGATSPTATAPTATSPTATAPTALPAAASGTQSGGALDLQAAMVAVIKKDAGLGSGVIYDAAGNIVTNAHVVGTSTTFKVTLPNGKSYPGTLVGSFSADDIAVIKISAPNLTPAVFGDSSKLSVGDFVLAMGNPLGLQSSVTEGIVSALGRQVSEPAGNALPDVIQTSAAINPGNSGGALVDLNGQVVGIPTLAATDPQLGGSAPGIGFAISSNRARTIADQLIASGKVTSSGRAYMGVQVLDSTAGVTVYKVTAGSPADKAGIQAGDLILSIDGQAIPTTDSLSQVLITLKPGDVAKIEVQHQDGTKATLSVTLGQLPG
jgi:S1-C subfamily serine protease